MLRTESSAIDSLRMDTEAEMTESDPARSRLGDFEYCQAIGLCSEKAVLRKTTSHKERLTTRFTRLSYSAAVLLLSVAFVAVPAHAMGTCTNATLIGAYGFQEQGQAIGAGFSEFRAVGVTNFDGKGNGRRSFTIWYSDFSVVSESDVAISYNVQSDCRFTFTYLSNGEIFSGVIVQNGRKLLYLETSGDPMRSGQAEKVKVDD